MHFGFEKKTNLVITNLIFFSFSGGIGPSGPLWLRQWLKPKFHYADFPETSPSEEISKFRGSRRNGIWAKGDVTGLSRTCRGRHGEDGIVEFGLYTALHITVFNTRMRSSAQRDGRPLDGLKFGSHFLPFVDQSSPN